MLKGLTNTIKNACNDIELTLSEYIVIGGKTIPIKAELNDDCYDNGNFIGTFILKELKFEASNEISYINKEFEYYKRINGESIKIGTFITTEINNSDSEEVTKVVAMDYGLKTQIEYRSNLDYSSGNITLLDVWNECCELSGLESGVTEFTNSDFIVTDDQFTGTGATIRDVFIGIGLSSGSFIKVMNDDKIYPIFNEYDSNIKSGNNITLENDINNNSIDIQIDGNTEQTTYSGKNKFNYITTLVSSNYGLTNTINADGSITTTGKPTRDYAYVVSGYVITDVLEDGETYTLSQAIASNKVYAQINARKKSDNTYTYIPSNNNTMKTRSFKVDKTTYASYTIDVQTGKMTDWGDESLTITNKYMLCKGTDNASTSFELYVGGQPSPNPDYPSEIKTVKGVSNLFDKEQSNYFYYQSSIDNNGNITNSAYRSTIFKYPIPNDKTISLSIEKGYLGNIFLYTKDGTFIELIQSNWGKTKTFVSTNAYFVSFAMKSDTDNAILYDDFKQNYNLQIEESSIAHDYVPYGHWLKVKNTGKNLFDKDNAIKGLYYDALGGLSPSVNWYYENIRVKPNTSYSISGNTTNNTSAFFVELNKNLEVVKRIGNYYNTHNFTTSNETYYVGVSIPWYGDSDGRNNINTFQVEKGSTATEYEPYKEQSILIDMNKYDDDGSIIGNYELCSIDNTKDKLNIDKEGNVSITQNIGEVVLDGSESWAKRNDGDGRTTISFNYNISNIGSINQMNNRFQKSTSSTDGIEGLAIPSQLTQIYIQIKRNRLSTLDVTGFKSWLSTHPVTVKYILDKPQTISLGKITPLKLLEGTNNITTNDKLQPNMKIEYSVINEIVEEYTELEDKRDTQPITCLRLGLSQIEGENVDIQDEDLIKKYGENWLIINDNPFAYTQEKRVELINAIFDKVKGFGYSAFVSKTSFKPYLTCGDVIKFKNKAGELVKSIVLRYNHNFDEITLEAPSETSATVNYVYPTKDIDLIKKTEIIVDKNTNQITSLTQQTTTIQNDLQQNYYDKTQTNQLIQTSSTGITNTFSEAGGNNIFRNTGLWFSQSDANNPYEYWTGKNVSKQNTDKSSNGSLMMLKKGTLEQEQVVSNGNYTVSFKYKKLIQLATCKVIVNDNEYELTQMTDTEWQTGSKDADGNIVIKPLEVTSNHINVKFTSTVDNAIEIYDLMVNAGTVKLAYSQNENEVTTDTVNISKGITITSSANDTKFKANADGIRIVDKNNEKTILTEFTDKGMSTKEMEVENGATIVKVLVQNVGSQTWFTRI